MRRLGLAASLVCDLRVLFLHEPNSGLDPIGRGEMWTSMLSLVSG